MGKCVNYESLIQFLHDIAWSVNCWWKWLHSIQLAISRSEQAPGSVFHPHDESGKIECDFVQPFWCNIKVDLER